MSDLLAVLAKEKTERMAAAAAIAKKDRFFNKGNALLTEFLEARKQISRKFTTNLVHQFEVLQQNLKVTSVLNKQKEETKVSLELEKKRKTRHSAARRRKAAKIAEFEKSLAEMNTIFSMSVNIIRNNLDIAKENLLPIKKYQSTMDCYNEWCEGAWEKYEEEISEFLYDIKADSKPDIFNVVQRYGSPYTKGDLWYDESLNEWLDDYQDKFEDIEEKLKGLIP